MPSSFTVVAGLLIGDFLLARTHGRGQLAGLPAGLITGPAHYRRGRTRTAERKLADARKGKSPRRLPQLSRKSVFPL